MTTTQQPEAILLANCADSLTHVAPESGINPFIAKMASELRCLHARNAWLEAELIKESFRTASESNRADQMSKQHDTQAALNRDARAALSGLQKRKDDWKWRALEAESQLEAIGAGGVESLRGDKPLTDNQIQAIDDSTHFHESPDWNLRFARAIEKHHGIGA